MATSRLEVDLSALERNLAVVRGVVAGQAGVAPGVAPGVGVCAVVKQDAYGLGAARIAKRLSACGVQMLAVYGLDEARTVADAVGNIPILVLMPVHGVERMDPLYRAAANGRLHLVVHDHDQLTGVLEMAGRLGVAMPVHVQLDTGLSRGGSLAEDAQKLVERVLNSTRARLAGLMTHFASPCCDEEFTREQAARFGGFVERVAPMMRTAARAGQGVPLPMRGWGANGAGGGANGASAYLPPGSASGIGVLGSTGLGELALHMSNSCATFRSRDYHGTMVRVGQSLYGYTIEDGLGRAEPSEAGSTRRHVDDWEFAAQAARLEAVARWTSCIVHTSEIPAGWPVGYGSVWKAPKRADGRATKIALIPVGYADGYPRSMGTTKARADGASNSKPVGWVGFTGRRWERRGSAEATEWDLARADAQRMDSGGAVESARAATPTVYAPAVGRVSMDQITVDVTDVPESYLAPMRAGMDLTGAEVELYGRDKGAPNYLPTLAAAAGTITHELLCRIGVRVERVYRYPAVAAGAGGTGSAGASGESTHGAQAAAVR